MMYNNPLVAATTDLSDMTMIITRLAYVGVLRFRDKRTRRVSGMWLTDSLYMDILALREPGMLLDLEDGGPFGRVVAQTRPHQIPSQARHCNGRFRDLCCNTNQLTLACQSH